MGIGEIIRELAAERRYGFDLERAVYLTVLHRLFISGSDRAAEAWKENYSIPGAEELALQHLYRAMVRLGQEIGQGSLRDSPMHEGLDPGGCLLISRRDWLSEVGLLFFDTTSIYFEGAGGQSPRGIRSQQGPPSRSAPDGSRGGSGCGGPTRCRQMWPGNTADAKSLLPVVERMRAKFRVRERCAWWPTAEW